MPTAKASPAHIEVAPSELANIAGVIIIVGDHDGHVRVTGSVERSATYRDMFVVETEVGSLYLSEDLPVRIVNSELPEDIVIGALAQAIGMLRAS